MLKQKRKEMGLTQKQLAEKSGVPWRTIQNCEDHVSVLEIGHLAQVQN